MARLNTQKHGKAQHQAASSTTQAKPQVAGTAIRKPRRAVYWRIPWTVFAALLVLLVGLTVLLYPYAAQWQTQYLQSTQIKNYNQNISHAEPSAAKQLAAAKAYNDALQSEAIYRSNTNIPVSYREGDTSKYKYEDLLKTGPNSPMARLQIPSIKLDLPVFHGTDDKTLLEGLGHLKGTSLPVGGIGTRAVITGHRGLAEAEMFTRLNEVHKGNMFFIQVMGKVLQYKVVSIQVIEPEDTQALLPDPKRDLVTLVTCTPLGINTQRILVTGERFFPVDETAAKDANGNPKIPRFPWFALLYGLGLIGALMYGWFASRHRLPLPVLAGNRSWYFRRRDTVRAVLGEAAVAGQSGKLRQLGQPERQLGRSRQLGQLTAQAGTWTAGTWTMVAGPHRAGISTLLTILVPQAVESCIVIDITRRQQTALRHGKRLIAYINSEIQGATSTPLVVIHGMKYVTRKRYVWAHMPAEVAVVCDSDMKLREIARAHGTASQELRIVPVGALSFAEWVIDLPSMQQFVDAERGIVRDQDHADSAALQKVQQLWQEYMEFGGYPELAEMSHEHRRKWLADTAKRVERLCKRFFKREELVYRQRSGKSRHITAVTVQQGDDIGLRDAGVARTLGLPLELCMIWNVLDTCESQGLGNDCVILDYNAGTVTCPVSMLEQQTVQSSAIALTQSNTDDSEPLATVPIWQFCIQRPSR